MVEDDENEFKLILERLERNTHNWPTPVAQAASRILGENNPYSHDCFTFAKNLAEISIRLIYAMVLSGVCATDRPAAQKSLVDVILTGNWKAGFSSLSTLQLEGQFAMLHSWLFGRRKPADELLDSFYALDPILEMLNKSTEKQKN